jgi:signal transduction histidine kinase
MRNTLTFLLLILMCPCFAQFQKFSDELFFNRYTTEDGLSQASINAIIKDSKGFVWLGSDDGLNRFDGHQFRVYKKKPGDSTTLIGNTVQTLWEDSLSRIWIGTSEGLSIYDRHAEVFQSYYVPGQEFYSCFDLCADQLNKRVWIAGGAEGLFYFDLRTEAVISFGHADLKGLNILKVERIGTKLYLGTLDKGLRSLDLRNGAVESIKIETADDVFAIRSLFADTTILWIGTEGSGLKKFDTSTGRVEEYTTKNNFLSNDKVWALEKSDKRLWVGTDGGGISVINLEKRSSTFHKHSYYAGRSLSSNTIRCITKDRIGDLWFGTFNGGVSYLPALNIKFHSFRNLPEDPFSLPHNSVLSFYELDNGRLLIGTDGGGLAYLEDGKFYSYRFPNNVPPPSVILTIKATSRGDIYLGTYQEGLYRIHPDKRVTIYRHQSKIPSSITSNIIWDIEEDADGTLWIATEVGLNRMMAHEDSFTSYRNRTEDDPKNLFTPDFTQTLLVDSANTLWVGYFGNLVSCYLPTGRMTSYLSGPDSSKHIPNKQILSLHLDKKDKNTIWFSSFGSGLVRFNTIDKVFTHVTQAQGLPSDQIFAIQSDTKGIVWFTSNKGLIRYDPLQKTFYVFENSFGVNTGPYKDNSGGQTSAGYLLFGGTNGFTAFWPSDVSFQKKSLDVLFTGFKLFNEDVPIDNSILEKSITETEALRIPYEQSKFVNFEFAVPNFLSPDMVQYQYMLEGFEDNWHTVDNKYISFTNLLPGTYRLKVKAGFPSGPWGTEKVLTLIVVPPWWMTWYARVAMIILLLAGGFAFYKYRTYRLNKRKAELERIVAEQYQEIHDKNLELAYQNEELSAHNEELLANRETINMQNKMLFDAQKQLREINLSLEKLVQQRTQKLNETITQLNKTIKELDAFLYSASHDLVSPLKSILGLVNLAKMENLDRNLDHYFNHIESSVNKLEAIIQTLMQHSFNTKTELKLETVDLQKIVEETIGELRFYPESTRIAFKYNLDNAYIVSDTYRLKIILSNLLGNAVKYHDSRKDNNVVELNFRNAGSVWTLDIVDNGIGIEKERLERVFELFYRATESAKGSGLGLYIVKDTIDRLGGSISVDSEIGKWTKFTLSLPVNTHVMLN